VYGPSVNIDSITDTYSVLASLIPRHALLQALELGTQSVS